MNKTILQLVYILICLSFAYSKYKYEWKSRSIIQVLTDRYARDNDDDKSECVLEEIDYCKGTYKGMLNHLDYIENLGFNAIWISPIIENTEKGYHGYHFKNLYTLNENFGKEEDLRALIDECHRRDIWVMADVVANHAGNISTEDKDGNKIDDFSIIYPFNKAEYYHETCNIEDNDWDTNQDKVENCRQFNLPDLKQENMFVKVTLINWIKDLIKSYKFDGIRIDTVPQVPAWFWSEFSSAAGVFQIGEVFNSRNSYVANYQNYVDSVFNYPLYYAMNNSFCKNATEEYDITGDMTEMHNYYEITRELFKDSTILGLFLQNHNNPRFLCKCNDKIKFKNALVMSLLYEGIPVYYYGAEQSYNGCEDPLNKEPMWQHFDQTSELYKMVQIINNFRKEQKIWNKKLKEIAYSNKYYVFSRGRNILVVTVNDSIDQTIKFKSEFPKGTQFCNVFNIKDCIFSDDGTNLEIKTAGEPKLYLKS